MKLDLALLLLLAIGSAGSFTPTVLWSASMPNVAGQGGPRGLFYDPTSSTSWYFYGGESAPNPTVTPVRVASFCSIIVDEDTNSTSSTPSVSVDKCQEIAPNENAADNLFSAVEACYNKNTGAIQKFAIISYDRADRADNSRVVAGRMHIYDIPTDTMVGAGDYAGFTPISISLRGGRPAFSSDCSIVYYPWYTTSITNTTVAVATNTVTGQEMWRSDISDKRYAGFAVSADDSTLYAATNSLYASTPSPIGIFALDASLGTIVNEYIWPEDGLEHNAWANVVLFGDQNHLYFVDDAAGLVKFNTASLSSGPIWSNTIATSSSKQQAYHRPAFNSDLTQIYASAWHTLGAVASGDGVSAWSTDYITGDNWASSDTKWGDALEAAGGQGGVYSASPSTAQCNDAADGTLIWTYGEFINSLHVVNGEYTLVGDSGTAVGLQTTTPTSIPTQNPTQAPTGGAPTVSTLAPVAAPSTDPTAAPVIDPTEAPTEAPAVDPSGATMLLRASSSCGSIALTMIVSMVWYQHLL